MDFCKSRMYKGFHKVCLMAFALLVVCANGFATGFYATVDRNNISLGETVTLTLSFEGGSPEEDPALPAVDGLRIEAGGGESTTIEIVNGAQSIKTSRSFEVTATKLGTIVIPSIKVKIDGKSYQSDPITLNVAKAAQPQADPRTSFLKLVIPKEEVYLGEVLPLEMQIYYQAMEPSEMPQFKEEGFTVGKFQQSGPAGTVVNGIRLNVLTLKTYVVPVKVGKLDLGPATMLVKVPKTIGRNFFGQPVVTEWQQVTLESNPQSLNVLPLPRENVPASFSGAVGSYAMTVNVGPTNVAVGDPITIKVQITGQGAVSSLNLPAQAEWKSFKIYPPTSEFQPADQLELTGTKTFALTAVPETTEVREVPPFLFSFFDTETKTYRTLTQPAVPITVRPSAASLPPPASIASSPTQEGPATNKDIVHIKPKFGAVIVPQPPVAQREWFYALALAPVLFWAGAVVHRRRQDWLANNPRVLRQRQVEQLVNSALKDLQEQAGAQKPVEFFATLFRLLQEQLGERLDVPASAITEAVLSDKLRPLGVPDDQLKLLHELFQVCNHARYAPQSMNEEMNSLVPKARQAVENLRRFKA